jgi:hypothetical protein
VSDRRFERQRAARAPRRRASTFSSSTGPRPDRVAAWAFLLGIFLILVAATTSNGAQTGATTGGSGGATTPAGPSGSTTTGPQATSAQLGTRTLGVGAQGDDVGTLQRILRARGYGALAVTGLFDQATAEAVRAFQSDARLIVDGVVGPQTRPALLRLMRLARATWYGPGLYGNRTACGGRLRRATLGVAHRNLPCGTPVTFYHRGRFVTLRVIDRGPFARGVSWDLTAAAARSIGMTQTSRLRAVH